MSGATRRAAVLGGNRIPFARSDGAYADASNQDMLTATLDGLCDALRSGRRAPRRGRRRRGPQAQPRLQPRARVRARQPPGAARRRRTTCSRRAGPAWRPRSCSPTRSLSGRSRSAWRAASTPPPTLRWRSTSSCAASLLQANRAPLDLGQAARAGQAAPAAPRACDPAQRGAAHGHVDGRAPGAHDGRVEDLARGAGRAGAAQSPQPGGRLRRRLPGRSRDAVPRAGARPEPASGLHAARSSRGCGRRSAARTGR